VLLAVLTACTPASNGFRPKVAGFRADQMLDVLGPDEVRSIDAPQYETAARAAAWLDPADPVLVVATGAATPARAYPLAILARHEIVNDVLGARALAVTYSPLTDTAAAYARALGNGRELTFGVSGKLYRANTVLLDRETRSLWSQIDGLSVAGELRGVRLSAVASNVVSFGDFVASHPRGDVLQRPTIVDYSFSAYAGYANRAKPFADSFAGVLDARAPAMARVVGVDLPDGPRAYLYDALRLGGDPAVLGDEGNVIFFGGAARSVLDTARIADGKPAGASGVFRPRARGRALTFGVARGRIFDDQTRSAWSLLGVATAGPLKGARLPEVPHTDAFWFAYAAFHPRAGIWGTP
jgi:hypothetical protein